MTADVSGSLGSVLNVNMNTNVITELQEYTTPNTQLVNQAVYADVMSQVCCIQNNNS